jgi:hypothetical protein
MVLATAEFLRSTGGHTDTGRTPSRIQIAETCGVTPSKNSEDKKIMWQGVLLSVQPRIRLNRSFDQRSHTDLGYSLKVRGRVGSEAREFLVAVGQGAHAKHQFQAGAAISGDALPVPERGWRRLNSTRSAS